MESKQLLEDELTKIEAWEKSQSGLWFWERIGRIPFKILDKLTPKFIHEKIGLLLDEIGSYIQTGGKYLIQEKAILNLVEKKANSQVESISDIEKLPLQAMIEASQEHAEKWTKVATLQGATTGIGGIFTLAVDIPALLGMSLKTLQEIAIIHGYDPNEKNERIFIIKCLQFSSADVVGKQAILKELSTFYHGRSSSNEMMSQLQGWREVVYTYRDQFGWKKLLQMIPIAGIIFGAISNRSMIQDLTETGNMLYRKRRILERLQNDAATVAPHL
ncbi:EcsC family protein [Fredinandcohnia sp. QZ13]|uniref:EcsC family protein n=1 Tax=Fredinandcohnia sp. QZ13 TaxID=3073144 RepID=UPI0028536D46|nr:EcsC family protein [Fredinandcohnia sp. QZ13]MDR4887266.1 EcsC family protein [Fredinandcohnia sp. QZ13]